MTHLTFIRDSDFTEADSFKENPDGSVQWFNGNSNGVIREGFTRIDEEGNSIGVWQKLLDLDAAGTISVQWLTQAEKDAIQAGHDAAIAEQQKRQSKLSGQEIAGHLVSLTEDNQNGLAAVLQGVELAAEMGADIFPLNFNAATPDGFKLIPFDDATAFKSFCLSFLSARQQFF